MEKKIPIPDFNGQHPLEKAMYILQDGIIIIDRNAQITYINRAAQEIFERQIGFQPSIGHNFLELARPGRKEITKVHIEDAFRNQASVFPLFYPQKGNDFWIELGYYPMAEEHGEIYHVCVRAKNITEQVLLEKEVERQRTERKLAIVRASIRGQEKERAEIGRELHDNVNQLLTTVKLYNEMALQEERTNKEILNKSIAQLCVCIQTIRDLSKRLTVPFIEEIDLKDIVSDLINSIKISNAVDIEFVYREINEKSLNKQLRLTIYRIIQEQLTNIIKYANASKVQVALHGTKQQILLDIQDNGKGCNTNAKKNGIGIYNMMIRAQSVNGKIHYESSPGNGFRLIGRFPVKM